MRILHVSHLYHPSIGGNQIQNKELSEKLVEMGEEVTVFTANAIHGEKFNQFDPSYRPLPERECIHGVHVRRFMPNYRLRSLLFSKLPRMRGGCRLQKFLFKDALEIFEHGPFIPQMLLEIRNLRPDVLTVTNNYHTTTYLCYLAHKFFHIPFIMRPAANIALEWCRKPIVDKMLHEADLIFAETPYEKEYLCERGHPEQKIVYNGSGIDPGKFNKSDGSSFRAKYNINSTPIVTFLARKAKNKGIEHLIDAMEVLWGREVNAYLVLAGFPDPGDEDLVSKRIRLLDKADQRKVINIDTFSADEKANIYAACDIFVQVPKNEASGTVYLEAWVSGKPIIACNDKPQASFIKHEKDGLLVSYGNKNELAEAILRLLVDAEFRTRLGENGKKKVMGNYTWDIRARQVRDEYLKLINKKGKS